MENGTILKTEDLCKFFTSVQRKSRLSFSKSVKTLKAVNMVNISIRQGENYAIVGESGSGKSTLGYMIARIFNPTSGRIFYKNKEVFSGEGLKEFRKRVQMVFQDPGSSLNPRHTIEFILSLPLKLYNTLDKEQRKNRVAELLSEVELSEELMPRYPGVLSGGQKQRVGLARALALDPELVVLDEPTSSLDVSVQAKILELLMQLKKKLGFTYVFITHDLAVVKNVADRIAVMYLGQIVELAETLSLFLNPLHPYTKALLSTIPVLTEEEKQFIPEEVILEGDIPSPINPPKTCPFLSRCQQKKSFCETMPCPDLKEVEQNHFVRCYLFE